MSLKIIREALREQNEKNVENFNITSIVFVWYNEETYYKDVNKTEIALPNEIGNNTVIIRFKN